jgi:hypothetical protein
MYLAADGKIYITSGSSVRHFSTINYPDSAGSACDVQQHSVFIGNFAHLRAIPNHPNYYLGCDTASSCICLTGENEIHDHDFKLSIVPNPSAGILNIVYLLPHDENGFLKIYDVSGKEIYFQKLSPWSTLQQLDLTFLNDGLYICEISTTSIRSIKKLAIFR